jgi:ABC-type dipeptide/oligopeptide/nickel transport system permease component
VRALNFWLILDGDERWPAETNRFRLRFEAPVMVILRYIGSRLLFFVPQIVGIVLVGFVLIKAVPGDPATLMLGPMASADSIARLRADLGLDKPVPVQFFIYLQKLAHGDFGTSWQTTQPVLSDLKTRFPATLELVTYGLLLALLIGIPLGVFSAAYKRGTIGKIGGMYGLVAGALPDFWLALVLVFIFYSGLHWLPSPIGRIDISVIAPDMITGFYTIDSLLTGNWDALGSSVQHLLLPVLTLGLINAGPILKMTQSTMDRMLNADFSQYERLCGLPRWVIMRHAFRNALPSIITIVSVLYGFLIGGAVLVEIVFSWGGAGQYAVQGVLNSDFNPVLGFVIFSALFSLVIYFLVDLAYLAIDPRIRH